MRGLEAINKVSFWITVERRAHMLIQSERVWISGQFFPAQILIEDGKIAAVFPYGKEADCQDMGELRIVPGFIDLHTHGAYGVNAGTAKPEDLLYWASRAPEEGITAFTPTTVTEPVDNLSQSVKRIRAATKAISSGAEILGVHMEGPYICLKYKGAQPPEHIANPSIEQMDRWLADADGTIRLMTVAPETDKDFAFIRHCVKRGVAVNIGHTDASYQQALLAVANGATGVTHTHNAMSAYHHRDLGVVNAALRCRDLFCEIIPDGIHVQYPTIASFFDSKGPHYAFAVTDSLLIKGSGEESCFFGEHEIVPREGGGAELKEDGTLAGSTLLYNQGLRNLVEKALVPFEAALNACTINPARRIGEGHRKGRIAVGYDGDLVALGAEYQVVQTWCKGRACL